MKNSKRKILALFQTFRQKIISVLTAGIMLFLLWLLYRLSPLAMAITGFIPQWRILGLAIASIGFLASNLFVQIPISVLLVLLTKESKLAQLEPYSVEKIEQDFTIPGFKISKILWFGKSSSEVKEIS